MRRASLYTSFPLALGLTLALVLLCLLSMPLEGVQAQEADSYSIYYVAPSCIGVPVPCYTTVQAAVDAADSPTDVIKVAVGIYKGVQSRPAVPGYDGPSVITQAVYISKSVTIRGGYTTVDWTNSHPISYPAILDAQGQGRVVYVADNISVTLEGLGFTGGNATGLGGGEYHYPDGDAGGGLYVFSTTVVLSNSRVFGNSATHGGGIYLRVSVAALTSNIISTNTAGMSGGGVYLLGSDVVISENTVSANTASGDVGGGVCSYNGTVTLNGNTVASNTSGSSGGGLYLFDSDSYLNGNTIVLNATTGGEGLDWTGGGGVYLWGKSRSLNGNIVMSNTSRSAGGGLMLFGTLTTLGGNIISANTAQGDGGGLYLFGNMFMGYNTLINNFITDNRTSGVGSGLHFYGSSAYLLHNTLVRNGGGDGSAVSVNARRYCYPSYCYFTPVVLTNTILVSHTIGVHVESGTAQLANTLWSGNIQNWVGTISHTNDYTGDPAFAPDSYHLTALSAAIDRGVDAGIMTDIDGQPRPAGFGFDLGADERPGAVLHLQQVGAPLLNLGQTFTYTVIVTSVDSNIATSVVLKNLQSPMQQVLAAVATQGTCTLGAAWGDAVTCNLGTLAPGSRVSILLTAWITTTPPARLPWSMRNTLWVTATEASNILYTDTTLQNCHARLNDSLTDYDNVQAAVDASTQPQDVVKVAGTCAGINTSGGLRQQVYLTKTLVLRGGYALTDWTASDPIAHPTILNAQGQGRVVYVAGNISPTLEGLGLTGGNATGLGGVGDDDAGGGLYIINATATLSDSQVFDNVAANWRGVGGGLYVTNAKVTLSSNRVFGNAADQGGGGYLSGGEAVLSGNIISANTAGVFGGGLYHVGGRVHLSGNTVIFNSAGSDGGGLRFVQDTVGFSGNTVISNTSRWSGGGLDLFNSQANLDGNLVSSNSASWGGGGLSLTSGNANLSRNTITLNTAGGGGGLRLYNTNTTLDANIISANTANSGGGGLDLGGQDNSTLTNNVITDNRAGGSGSGLIVSGSHPRLFHNTIARNTGSNGVYVTGFVACIIDTGCVYIYSSVALTNNILVSHTVGISVTEGDTAILNSTLWNGNTQNWGGGGTITHTNDYTGDPTFTLDGYHLMPGSAAVGRGVNAGVTTDIDGETRPSGTGYDLGADEYYPHPALTVSKAATYDPVRAGTQLTYTVRVVNTGNVDLHVTVTDTLPAHIIPSETPGGTPILPGGLVTWATSPIAPRDTWATTFVVIIEEDYTGPLTNIIRATAQEGATGSYTLVTQAAKSVLYFPWLNRLATGH